MLVIRHSRAARGGEPGIPNHSIAETTPNCSTEATAIMESGLAGFSQAPE
jgi:hypothetical protein